MLHQDNTKHTYKPFRYPPNYQSARLHKNVTHPGKCDPQGKTCPCCQQKEKVPFRGWFNRSIEQDFKKFRGGVVTYFWLIRLYSISIITIIVLYGIYLQYLTDYYCSVMQDLIYRAEICGKLFGIWIIKNKDLKNLIQKEFDFDTLARLLTLRSVVFLLLLITNILSLYIIKWFKIRYPDKINIANYSLLFKNIKDDSIDLLLERLKLQFGQFQVHDAFVIKKIEPFYTAYQQKLELYYAVKIEKNQKKLKKMFKKLQKLDRYCSQNEESFYNEGGRAIIVFNELSTKENILKKYQISSWKLVKMFFSNSYEEQFRAYCEKCPHPEEILWNNIGILERQGFKLKILSILYFFLILGFIVFFLYFFMEIVYVKKIQEPYKTILTNFSLMFVVFTGLTFRTLMNKLAQMRFPNTYTARAKFIVITTVLFHFIFYLVAPSLYLKFSDRSGVIMSLISNQAVNFIIVQMVIAGFDLIFCCWNRNLKNVQDEDRPIGCQKMLHEKMQFPRFPIEFKLIILFKIWILITFFSFQVPLVLFLILLAMIFLYFKDKLNIYNHYRMEIIDSQVEFNFLRYYSNVFSIYLFTIYATTQNEFYELTIGAAVTVLSILFQTIYFRKLNDNEPSTKDSFVHPCFKDLEISDSYQMRYKKFLDEARSDQIDIEIKEELSRNGYGTMKTEETLVTNLIQP